MYTYNRNRQLLERDLLMLNHNMMIMVQVNEDVEQEYYRLKMDYFVKQQQLLQLLRQRVDVDQPLLT